MPASLTSRKTQFELLARACQLGQRARLVTRTPEATETSATTRFVALEQDAVCLHWPVPKLAAALTQGVTVEVRFEHGGSRYSFEAQVRGCIWRHVAGRGRVSALKLSLPLRLDRSEQRRNFRYGFSATDAPVEARFSAVGRPDVHFAVRVQNVSRGGIGGETDDPTARRVRAGELFCVQLRCPGDDRALDLFVRIAHAHTRTAPGGERTALGCVFCPVDDPRRDQDNLRRLERLVVEKRQAVLKRAAAGATTRR